MKHILASAIVLTAFTVLTACAGEQMEKSTAIKHISAQEVKQLLDKKNDVVLLDVRTEAEYTGALGHIETSILIPLQELTARVDELQPYKEKRIIIYCRSGNRSQVAAKILMKKGYDVVNMLGGMIAWNKL